MGTTWTNEQQKVIDLRNRNILVSAAAGSGKTAVLVERIIQMITDDAHPVDIDGLLVVTFTKAAAAEMKERIGQALERRLEAEPENARLEKQAALLDSAQITTIHSFCLNVIRNHFNEIDLDPSFRVAEDTELMLLRADTMENLLEEMYAEGDEDFLQFIECYAKGKTDAGIEALIEQVYDYSRSYPWPDLWLDKCIQDLLPENEDSLIEAPLIVFLSDYIVHVIDDLISREKEALEICALPDGPALYADALQSDLAYLSRLKAVGRFDGYKAVFDTLKWESLSRKKMPDASEEQKAAVKLIRDGVKKTVSKLKEDFFYADMQTMLSDIRMSAKPMQVLISLVKAFSERYQKLKEEKNVLDFNDLEHFALNILIRREGGTYVRTAAAEEYARQFEEVLCDEYQDSNLVQETLLKAVSREALSRPNIFMVGDVKQSIYKFRLARPELFMEKYNSYSSGDSLYQRIDLHKNFRSRACVVDFVNLIFYHIMGRALGGIEYDDNAALYCGANFPETEAGISHETEIVLVDSAGEDREQSEPEDEKTLEARAVAVKIRDMIAGNMQVFDRDLGGYRRLMYKDIVILLRTVSGWAQAFVSVLEEEGIPAYAEISAGFFDTPEVRTVLCYLAVIDNPFQDIELAASLKSCIGGFEDEALAIIRSVIDKGCLYDACKAFADPASDIFLEAHYNMAQCRAIRGRLQAFMTRLEGFKRRVSYMPVHQLLLAVFEETGYYNMMSAMPAGKKRQANLDLLMEKAVDYESTSYHGLFNFVRYIKRLKKYDADFGEAAALGEGEDVLRLMSIHKSKGLEYPVVFLCGMSKRFNQQDARSSILLHSDYGLGPEAVDPKRRIKCPTILKKAMAKKIVLENLSEELRVLYVALTRAKERLILTGCVNDAGSALESWKRKGRSAGAQLLLTDLIAAGNYFDWVMPVVLHEAYRSKSSADIKISRFGGDDFKAGEVKSVIDNQAAKYMLTCMDASQGDAAAKKLLDERLLWQYPYAAQLHLHTKLTVTELKRLHEADADERDMELIAPDKPAPVYDEAAIEAAAKRGSAMHKMMELLDFTSVKSLDAVKQFIERLIETGVLEAEAAMSVNPFKIYNCIRSELGQRMRAAAGERKLLRERQFVMGMPASELFDTDDGEMILIQGIIDAYFEEAGEIVLVDYKSDYVPEKNERFLTDKYKVQLDYYEAAIERMLKKKVKERYIYSFYLDKAIQL